MLQDDQVQELKQTAPDLSAADEGGFTYLLLKSHSLPKGCTPANVDLLLCPQPKSGYNSILYFSEKPAGKFSLNWNGNVHVLGRNWFSYSWKTSEGLTLLQMVQVHLNALRTNET